MLLAFVEDGDNSSQLVLDWLNCLDSNFKIVILKEGEVLDTLSIELSSNYVSLEELLGYKLSEFRFYYYRRGKFGSYFGDVISLFNETAVAWFRKEENRIFEYLEKRFLGRCNLGSYTKEISTNKLFNLKSAVDSGFKIPSSLVTSSKKKLLEFSSRTFNYLIVKPISDHKPLATKDDICFIPCGTQIIGKGAIENLQDHFVPCLFQEYIIKKYEIRIFYIYDKLYPMAIFSQNNEKAKVDFRNYDKEVPNRCVPFKLNATIEENVKKFINISGYNTGSIDLLYGEDGNYYFLEINHCGIYEWLSENCNYYIDMEIANQIYEKSRSQN